MQPVAYGCNRLQLYSTVRIRHMIIYYGKMHESHTIAYECIRMQPTPSGWNGAISPSYRRASLHVAIAFFIVFTFERGADNDGVPGFAFYHVKSDFRGPVTMAAVAAHNDAAP
jgi:hypothetical protein